MRKRRRKKRKWRKHKEGDWKEEEYQKKGKGERASDGGGQHDQSKLSILGDLIIKANILWLIYGLGIV